MLKGRQVKTALALAVALILLGSTLSTFDSAVFGFDEASRVSINETDKTSFSRTYELEDSTQISAEWNKTYGGVGDEDAYCVRQTSEGGYILAGSMCPNPGTGNWDFWFVRTDACGNMLWNKSLGGAYPDMAYFVQQTSDGGYIVAGDTESFGAGNEDVWLVKIEPDGILPVYDVAVIGVEPSNTAVKQGDSLPINVTVKNVGSFQETFNVTLSYNSSQIETQTVSGLNPCNRRTLTFIWNTTDVAPGNYTISAYATPLPNETETDNNLYIDGTVTVRLPIHDVTVISVEPEKTGWRRILRKHLHNPHE
jgi:hypothetical protein